MNHVNKTRVYYIPILSIYNYYYYYIICVTHARAHKSRRVLFASAYIYVIIIFFYNMFFAQPMSVRENECARAHNRVWVQNYTRLNHYYHYCIIIITI